MKRLRAPEHSDSRASSPAAGAPDPQATTDPTCPPSSATVPVGETPTLTETPAGGEMSQPVPEPGASAAEPQQPNPAPQEVEPMSRCNGEASADLHSATDIGDEQG